MHCTHFGTIAFYLNDQSQDVLSSQPIGRLVCKIMHISLKKKSSTGHLSLDYTKLKVNSLSFFQTVNANRNYFRTVIHLTKSWLVCQKIKQIWWFMQILVGPSSITFAQHTHSANDRQVLIGHPATSSKQIAIGGLLNLALTKYKRYFTKKGDISSQGIVTE